ncbi:MAG: WbqC family protein [Bacteroidaceae bacterium]|nr:WbqC family protein [Bacteroidaceae bacterium]MBR5275552.1 WbqC family protein [Bacteroidaceae bacterium]
MNSIISHPLYLAPVPLYAELYRSNIVLFDGCSPFVKQTYRNRAIIATENGTQNLTVPVVHNGQNTPMRDVRISEHGNWRHQHWNAIVSAYRKSPFFDYYADDFAHFYEERDGFLIDFNMRLHGTVCELLGLEREAGIITGREELEAIAATGTNDLRRIAEPKALTSIEEYTAHPYYQVFAQRHGFIPNLSIVDLLFNMGPEGLIQLRDSMRVK